MFEPRKAAHDYEIDIQDLSKITKEAYGIEFDLQMGERSQGEYEIVTTGAIDSIQGYWTGLGQGYGYRDKYKEGSKWVAFGMEGVEEGEGIDKYDNLDTDLNVRLALEKWVSQDRPEEHWRYGQPRPFDRVGDNGEYVLYQPDLDVVMTDLANKNKIPHGTYLIRIDW